MLRPLDIVSIQADQLGDWASLRRFCSACGGRSRAVDLPGDAELVNHFAVAAGPEGFLERDAYLPVLRQRSSNSSRPDKARS